MSVRRSRRDVLLAMGGAATIPLISATGSASAQAVCDEEASLEAEVEEIRGRLRDARADLERLPDLLTERQRQILQLQAERSEPRFPADVRAEAGAVGLGAREPVVVLDVVGPRSQGTATAWFVTDHHLLTNAHNLETDPTTVYGVTLGGETFEAEVVGRVESQWPDVALLRTDHTGMPLPVGDSRSLSRDDPLVQVGHPGAEGFGFWAITLGAFRSRDSPNQLTATVPGLTGSSGSPILDLDGAAVAMTYGGGSVETADVTPTDDEVRVGPLAAEPSTSAVPIETAMDHVEGWT